MTPYHVRLVNPKSSEERTIAVHADAAAAEAAPCFHTYVQELARSEMPDGFMPISCGVRPVAQ